MSQSGLAGGQNLFLRVEFCSGSSLQELEEPACGGFLTHPIL